MAYSREAILTALTTRLAAIPTVNTVTRKYRVFEEWKSKEQPAIVVVFASDQATNDGHNTRRWAMRVELYVSTYDRSSAGPASEFSGVLDSIADALDITTAERNQSHRYADAKATTLGGLVESVEIVSSTIDVSMDGAQNVALVQVEIQALA